MFMGGKLLPEKAWRHVSVLLALGVTLFMLAAPVHAWAEADSDVNSVGRWITFDFPRDSPVLPVSLSMGSSTAKLRGASVLLDIHAAVVLRNVGAKALSGITIRVEAQDLQTGRGSVTVPSLVAQPGETFPVTMDMEILRPIAAGRAATVSLVQLSLDCALFSDLSAYGPDLLHSRHSLLLYELEARQEREYLAALLHNRQWAKLRDELNFGLPESSPSRLGLEFVHGPLTAVMREQAFAVSPVAFSGAPVQPIGGGAKVMGNEVRSPYVEVRRISNRSVRSLELGWIVRDDRGHDFVAGSIPVALSSDTIQTVKITDAAALRFSNGGGEPMVIGALRAFVSDVEFTDGKLWIPSRNDIDDATSDPILRHELANSPEQQRLAKIYRLRGTTGLAEELKRTN
jgi:hypothetical protein